MDPEILAVLMDPSIPVEEKQKLAMEAAQGLVAPASQHPYSEAVKEFRFVQRPQGPAGFIESETGKIMYQNGAIYDPETGQVLYPPTVGAQVSIQGSNAWLGKIQEEWSDEKISEWRKKLASQGYEVEKTGGWSVPLLRALKQYHETRYANFGRPLPAGDMEGGKAARVGIRETYDKKVLKQDAKTWGYDVFGEELDDDEAEYFADRILDVAQKLARKHKGEWTTEQVHKGAERRVWGEFVKDPMVADALEEAEELEGNLAIRNSVISVSQLAGL